MLSNAYSKAGILNDDPGDGDVWIPDVGTPLRLLRPSETLAAHTTLVEHSADFGSKRVLTRKLALNQLAAFERAPNASPSLTLDGLIDEAKTRTLEDADDSSFLPKTTPYENSFASRLLGFGGSPGLRDLTASDEDKVLIYRDWESRPPWADLMEDIHAHYTLKYDLQDHPPYEHAPIDYVSLQEWHLREVNDMLETIFWPGIDVTSNLEYSPELYTVVAMYKRVVVGAAFISPPPDEAYITYIAVKPGWDRSGIAFMMLYLLIASSPDRDIILHVSADNPAMILYNKFGFKAEEFVVGFYEDYLDPNSKACRNALRLRLRQR